MKISPSDLATHDSPNKNKKSQENMTATNSAPSEFCPTDPSSFANPHQVVTKHIHLNWSVDFVSKTISGWAEYSIKALVDSGYIVMDIKGISIKRVTVQEQAVEVIVSHTPFSNTT